MLLIGLLASVSLSDAGARARDIAKTKNVGKTAEIFKDRRHQKARPFCSADLDGGLHLKKRLSVRRTRSSAACCLGVMPPQFRASF